jgi:ribosomal protein S18 acetylase RimI-like enzyme
MATLRDPNTVLRVAYLEQTAPPAAVHGAPRHERVDLERLGSDAYLALYRLVGGPYGWDRRLALPQASLDALLGGGSLRIYVLRDAGTALGLCEFDHGDFPDIELTNFGVAAAVQGRGLGPWLLARALQAEWASNPRRIWLHTDTWDHPAAQRVYERAGFRVFDLRDEAAGPL